MRENHPHLLSHLLGIRASSHGPPIIVWFYVVSQLRIRAEGPVHFEMRENLCCGQYRAAGACLEITWTHIFIIVPSWHPGPWKDPEGLKVSEPQSSNPDTHWPVIPEAYGSGSQLDLCLLRAAAVSKSRSEVTDKRSGLLLAFLTQCRM